MNIRLASLVKELAADAPQQAAPAPVAPVTAKPDTGEYNVGFDFTEFERKIAGSTEQAKTNFQNALLGKIGNKKVTVRASKGYGQPEKDYTINVSEISVDFYYERYVVVLKDEKGKEYFLKPGYKVKILGVADPVQPKKKKEPVAPPQPVGAKSATNFQPKPVSSGPTQQQ